MIRVGYYQEDSRIVESVLQGPDISGFPSAPQGYLAVFLDTGQDIPGYVTPAGVYQPQPAKPSEAHEWSPEVSDWVLNEALFDRQAWSAFQARARTELAANDLVYTRCGKAGIPYPADWQAYDEALRTIVRTSDPIPGFTFPTRPEYPEGT